MRRRMLFVVLIVLFLGLFDPFKIKAENDEYAWVLIDAIDYRNEDKWKIADDHESYAYSYSYNRGIYEASVTYEGDDIYDQGLTGTFGIKATFGNIPNVIYPNEAVVIDFSFSQTINSTKGLSFTGYATADFDQWDVGPGGRTGGSIMFADSEGNTNFTTSTTDDNSYSGQLTASLGSGREGSRIALRVQMSIGTAMGTNFIYDWQKVEDATANTDDIMVTPPKKKVPIEQNYEFWEKWAEQANKWTEADIEEAKNTSKIVKYGDLHGEVIVLRGWEEDIDQAIFVDFDTPIYHGDLIITKRRSGAILSFSDMSTYQMEENTSIILDIKSEKTTNIEQLAGVIWGNFKNMMKDGSLNIEMGQAVAGIKATTFVCEVYEEVSTLKVIEGSIAYTSLHTNDQVLVNAGEMVDAHKNGLDEVMTFDIEEEKIKWSDVYEYINQQEKDDEKEELVDDVSVQIEEDTEQSGFWLYIIGGGIIVIGLSIALLSKKKGNSK
ncbi:MAG: FecR domain-containing protein [Erysipelotrichaceae bacterium]|nr:FecR domain-containing protein [Erysipelotrichaceae bacterium]